jgi:hypothetical protein
MGVRIYYPTPSGQKTRHYRHADDWYVNDEKVLQVYQPVGGDTQYVIAEYNSGSWDFVEYEPLPDPRPASRFESEEGSGTTDEAERDEINPDTEELE